jgi:hypothetical protein
MDRRRLTQLVIGLLICGLVTPRIAFGSCCCSQAKASAARASCCQPQPEKAGCCHRDATIDKQAKPGDCCDSMGRNCKCHRSIDAKIQGRTFSTAPKTRGLQEVPVSRLCQVTPLVTPSVDGNGRQCFFASLHGPPLRVVHCVWLL